MEEVKTKVKRKYRKPRSLAKVTVESFPVTYEEYEDWKPRDGYKYEWKNGYAYKYDTYMKNTERFIVKNISRKFNKSRLYEMDNELFHETKCKLSEYLTRIPDISMFSREQVIEAANGGHPVPSFVIEVISKNENSNDAGTKVKEYFLAGVQTLWHVFPLLKQVWVFNSANNVTICEGDTFCEAVQGFGMTANEVFAL